MPKPSITALAWAAAAAAVLAGLGVHALDTAVLPRGHHVQAVNMESAYVVGLDALFRRDSTNLQTFTGAVGGVTADAITESDNVAQPYEVSGSTFPDYGSAVERSCDNQHNSCSDIANTNATANVTVAECDQQNTDCKNAASTATQTAFTTLVTSDADFDYYCDL